jgi:5' nucleotidase, deoxy (Pyrimidine), cytosolic type C protein (NT5C)
MSKPLRLVTDCDGVVFDFVGAMLRWKNSPLEHKDVSSWTHFPKEEIDSFQADEELCESVIPIVEGVHLLHLLKLRGWEVVFATARGRCPEAWITARESMVKRLFNQSVVWTDRKLEIEADMIVDDYAKNLQGLSVNAQQTKVLLHRPWSGLELLSVSDNVKLATNYKEVEEYARIIERSRY